MKLILPLLILFSIQTAAQILDFEVQTVDNDWTSIEKLQGENLTVIDFWATYCKPCVSAIPKLNTIYNDLKNKGVEVIGVNIDGPRNQSKVKPMINALGVDYPIVKDLDKQLMTEMNINVLPSLVIINKKGRVIFLHEGYSVGDDELIRNKILKLLEH